MIRSTSPAAAPTIDPLAHILPPVRRPGLVVGIADAALRAGLAAGLEAGGFDVWPAETGLDALDTYLAHTGEVDVLLIAADLPDLPADDFYRRLRANFPGVPFRVLDGRTAAAAAALGATVVAWPQPVATLSRALWDAVVDE
jgi:CheY-like chemotaxis protein